MSQLELVRDACAKVAGDVAARETDPYYDDTQVPWQTVALNIAATIRGLDLSAFRPDPAEGQARSRAEREVFRWAQALLTALNVGDVQSESGLHQKLREVMIAYRAAPQTLPEPIPMLLECPGCGTKHVDAPDPERDWTNPPHKSHLCHDCGLIWRPADVCTVGVERLETRGSADTWPA